MASLTHHISDSKTTRKNFIFSTMLGKAGLRPTCNKQKSLAAGENDDCSGTTGTTASTKQVGFVRMVLTRPYIGRNSYTPEEIQATWYTSSQYAKIQRDNIKTIRKMELGVRLCNKKYCPRGLERHVRTTCIAREQNKKQAFRAVLNEQLHQIEEISFDDDAIANIYHQITASCQLWANLVGKRDEREIEAYMDDNDSD